MTGTNTLIKINTHILYVNACKVAQMLLIVILLYNHMNTHPFEHPQTCKHTIYYNCKLGALLSEMDYVSDTGEIRTCYRPSHQLWVKSGTICLSST